MQTGEIITKESRRVLGPEWEEVAFKTDTDGREFSIRQNGDQQAIVVTDYDDGGNRVDVCETYPKLDGTTGEDLFEAYQPEIDFLNNKIDSILQP